MKTKNMLLYLTASMTNSQREGRTRSIRGVMRRRKTKQPEKYARVNLLTIINHDLQHQNPRLSMTFYEHREAIRGPKNMNSV
ncbi:hypothetical protein E2C01_064435 [Portunus trituberculatus]|uniref:Uncharacterized protein n=1 Tax=Portunus trituberculatus TaxID=210409 RepID=A0A5B7HJ27_PORTR|nr:hypothetical protein [Portunus trituberculatus]